VCVCVCVATPGDPTRACVCACVHARNVIPRDHAKEGRSVFVRERRKPTQHYVQLPRELQTHVESINSPHNIHSTQNIIYSFFLITAKELLNHVDLIKK
jgi:hypothetical protein